MCHLVQTLSAVSFFGGGEHCFRYVMTDLEPVFSYQNELVIDIIDCMFQFNARRIFHKVLYMVDKEKILWKTFGHLSVMSAILHGATIICCSQEMWQSFVMNTVGTNLSAELLYVHVQCMVISLEYLKWDSVQTWRCHFLNWQLKLHLSYSRTTYCNGLYLHSVKCFQLQNALFSINFGALKSEC